ncbi:hypothetical protein [Amycolatopsis sp. NPDC051372]|uniref:hypothetical protein n=1 Tax=Amycolatopsis sp. NPDC051372 TaxID=3155669 RepID=UPI0034144D12
MTPYEPTHYGSEEMTVRCVVWPGFAGACEIAFEPASGWGGRIARGPIAPPHAEAGAISPVVT